MYGIFTYIWLIILGKLYVYMLFIACRWVYRHATCDMFTFLQKPIMEI